MIYGYCTRTKETYKPNEPSAPEPYQPEGIICLVADLPAGGWEFRTLAADNEWEHLSATWDGLAIVEARPIPKPPLMVEIPRDAAVAFVGKTEWIIPEIVAIADPINAALAAESES